MAFKFANNPTSKLLSAISATATGLVALAGEGAKFPTITSPDEFRITLFDATNKREICKVTNRTVDTFTILRNQEGTTSPVAGWPAGTAFRLQLTRDTLKAFLQLDDAHLFTKQQNFPEVALTYGASIPWNLETQQVATVLLTGSTATMAVPTNLVNGGTYILTPVQDLTGARALIYPSANYDFGADGAPDHSLRTANKFDIVTFVAKNGKLRGAYQLDFTL